MEYIDGYDLATLVETCDVEMKKAAGRDGKGAIPDSVWASYSAMANTCGGVILLGMEQLSDNEFRPYHLANARKMVHDFWCTLNDTGKVSKNILTSQDVAVQTLPSGEDIVVVRVRQASRQEKPVFINNKLFGGTYKRLDEGDFLCSDEEVKRMLAEQVSETMDDGIFVGYGLDDLDMPTFNDYRQRFSNRQPDHPFNKLEPLEFLRVIGGYRQDRQSGEKGLTLAGLLMFGKLNSILDCLPNYIVDYQERPREVSELRWLDRVTTDFNWPCNLFSFYQTVIPKLFAGLKVPFKLENSTVRVDDTPVHKAVREAFVNMMIHADFHGRCSLLVVKRPGVFIFRNPGLSRLPKEEMLRGGHSDCRNRNMQKMFQFVGLAEQAGSGIPKIYYGWDSQDWKRPDYEESIKTNEMVLTLRMSSLLPDETVADVEGLIGAGNYRALAKLERLALVTAFAEGCVSHGRLMTLTTEHGADVSIALGKLTQRGYLASQGHGKATIYYPMGHLPVSDELCYSTPVTSSPINEGNSPINEGNSPINGSDSLSHHSPKASKQPIVNLKPIPRDAIIHSSELLAIAEPVRTKKRVTPNIVDEVIVRLCRGRFLTMPEIAELLNRKEKNVRDVYLSRLCKEDGPLRRRYPMLNDPRQQYTAKEASSEPPKTE